MIIETAHSGMYFSLTYLAALLIAAAIATYSGFRNGYPKIAWLLILLTGGIFFIIGEKMFSWSADQWTLLFTRFYFSPIDKKTILGGIIGLFAGLILAKTILKFKLSVIDHFAIALPLAMAISRIGCLMAGCCYGTPTSLPWGIRYDASSMAYHSHLSHRLIDLHHTTSLAVHPAQLYQVIGCLLIALLVWRTRKYWKARGSMFLFSVISYVVLRFFVEFVRDSDSSFVLVQVYYRLKAIQWILLAATLLGALLLCYREINFRKNSSVFETLKIKDFRIVWTLGFLLGIAVMGKNWFTKLELQTIIIFLTPVTFATLIQLFRKYTAPGFRWVAPLVFMGGCMFMAQTTIPEGKDKDKTKFIELGINGIYGIYHEQLEKVSESGGCNAYSPYRTQEKQLYQSGFDLSHNAWKDNNYKFKIGARLFFGSETGDIEPDYPSNSTFGLSPYVNFDWEAIGFSGGFSVGQMKFISKDGVSADDFSSGQIVSTSYETWNLIPSLSLRLGPLKYFYLEGYFPGLFPSCIPYAKYRIGMGSGLGKTNGTKVAVGKLDDEIFADLAFPIKNKFVLTAFYANSFLSDDKAKSTLSVGFNYRFQSKNSQMAK